MTTKKWKLLVTPLSGSAPLHQLEIEAGNWMSALRNARKVLGEDGGMPAGASCSVAPDGTVTILDAGSRRKFLLAPEAVTVSATVGAEPAPAAAAPPTKVQLASETQPAQAHIAVTPSAAATQAVSTTDGMKKKRKFETIAYTPGDEIPGVAVAAKPEPQHAPAPAQPDAAQVPAAARQDTTRLKKKKFETVAFTPDRPLTPETLTVAAVGGAAPVTPTAPAEREPTAPSVATQPAPDTQLELIFTRDEEPGGKNPLTYRERAFVVPKSMTVTEAEAALRFTLAHVQEQIRAAPRGKFVNLAAFDHRWTDKPDRPPLIVLEWRDWRGEASVDYPAAERTPSLAPADDTGETDERIASVFESLHELAHLRSAAQALDFVVKLLQQAVASSAISGCLYDINTDELRFVAVSGPGASARQGQATARSAGLFGLAGGIEHAAIVIPDARVHPSFNPATDGREGLEVQNMLLRPVVHEGQLLAMLQLINHVGGPFSAADVHVVNYIADRLSEFLRQVRVQPHP